MDDHETRRKVIREWMALPKEKRQTEEQATAFATKACPAKRVSSRATRSGPKISARPSRESHGMAVVASWQVVKSPDGLFRQA